MDWEPEVRRRRTAIAVIVTVLVVVVLAIGLAVTTRSKHHTKVTSNHGAALAPATDSSSTTAPSGPASALVVHDGDTVRLAGSVESAPGHPVYACPPVAVAGVGSTGPTSYTPCTGAVPIRDVDLNKLTNRSVTDSVVYGEAQFSAVYQSGELTVVSQEPYNDPRGNVPALVPCTAPAGGWPRNTGDSMGNLDLDPVEHYRDTHPGTIIDLALLRPSSSQVLAYVLTAGDPAPVQAALQPVFGSDLCVFRSVYTKAQIDTAMHAFDSMMGSAWSLTQINGVGLGLSSTQQDQVQITVPMMSQSLADAIDAQPAGLVSADTWLTPVS